MGDISETGFQAIAYDPNLGATDGAGIAQVIFTLRDGSGGVLHTRTENQAAYCAFGGDAPCNAMPPGQWAALPPGNYTLVAEARSSTGRPSETTSVSFSKP